MISVNSILALTYSCVSE
jgi:hypothetical protein